MTVPTRALAAWAALLALLAAPPAVADAIRILSGDDRGVTIELRVPAWTSQVISDDGRVRLSVPGFHALSEPGRPLLPAIGTTLAIPPGASVSVRVLQQSDEESREGLRVEIAPRQVFRHAPGSDDEIPGLEPVPPIRDGAWPASAVSAGRPWEMRGRRFVSLEFRPFSADEGSGTVRVARTLTVRVDFSRPAPRGMVAQRDAHADAIFEGSVLNFAQGRDWRRAPGGAASFRAGPTRFARGAATPAGVQAVDGTQPYVRVTLDSTALYLLPFDDLQPAGYPSGVPIAEVSVQRFEFLEGADPPYGAVDIPCEVEDLDGNGLFNSGDAIWVWTQNWAERSRSSLMQRFWGDAEVLYVTRKPTGGLRVAQRRGWRDATGLTPLATYPNLQHFEKNYDYTAYPADTTQDTYQWTPGTTLYYQRPDTLLFEVTQIDTTQPVLATMSWQGRDANSHWIFSGVRNGAGRFTPVIDSAGFFGKIAYTGSATIPGGALTEGRTNYVRSWAKTYGSAPDPVNNQFTAANFNWFELTWQRRFRAIRDYLRCNSGAASGLFQLHLRGFTASDRVRAYDLTDPGNPVRVTLEQPPVNEPGIGYAYELQDSAEAGVRREYVIARSPKTPPASRYQAMTLRDLAAASAADYIVVVPEAFLSVVQPLVDLRESQGLRVLVAPLESVCDAFNGGRRSGWAIRRLAEFAYQKWDTRFLLLFGDGTMDARGYGRLGQTDWIPIFPIRGPVGVAQGLELIASDPWYGCVSDSVKAMLQSGLPIVPDLFVGRLPAQSLAQAQGMVAKILRYETVSATDTWRRHVLLESDDAFSGESLFGTGGSSAYCYRAYEQVFQQINEQVDSVIVRDAGLRDYNAEVFSNRYYIGDVPIEPPSPGDTCRIANIGLYRSRLQPPLFSRLNAGVLWWNFQGHANESLLAHEEFYMRDGSTSDASLFANDDSLFFFTAFSCHANAFAYMQRVDSNRDPCIGEEMVQVPRRGAIATYASSGFELVPTNPTRHFNVFLARAMFSDPPRDEILGDRGSRVVLGEAIAKSLYHAVNEVQTGFGEHFVGLSYNLLGDPALRMSIGAPRTYVSANAVPVTDGQPVRVRTPGDTLMLVADLVSTVRLDSLGLWDESAAGRVPIDAASYSVTPAFPDTAAGNLYGGRRYTLTYQAPFRVESYDYRLRTIDRDGLVRDFRVPFELRGVLRVDGAAINSGDAVAPTANLSLLFLSPKPVNAATDLSMSINGAGQTFDAVPAPGDASGREWILSWTHAAYVRDDYNVRVQVAGSANDVTALFRVTVQGGELRLDNLFAFPNPFEDELGVRFSFLLAGSEPADIKMTVFTVTGKQIFTRIDRGLAPGYHQLAWDGRDLEGDKLANGVYFYRISAVTPGGAKTSQLGRLAKLRKPRRVADPVVP